MVTLEYKLPGEDQKWVLKGTFEPHIAERYAADIKFMDPNIETRTRRVTASALHPQTAPR